MMNVLFSEGDTFMRVIQSKIAQRQEKLRNQSSRPHMAVDNKVL